MFDLGTGLRPWGRSFPGTDPVTLHALVTHLHWDHVQESAVLRAAAVVRHDGAHLRPRRGDDSMATTFGRFMCPPYFPIRSDDLPAAVHFHDVYCGDFSFDDTSVMSGRFPTPAGPTATA
ncbi:MAG: hypothetical protein R2695_20905 [Acidimicrobiales bacterium]